tara:strand:+ start:2174 stop:2359 length:186 start_codon:yes stop_codon:yes gene_type:complete
MENISNKILKPVTLENIPALLQWIRKHSLSIDQVRQVYFMTADIEETLKSQIVKTWTYTIN